MFAEVRTGLVGLCTAALLATTMQASAQTAPVVPAALSMSDSTRNLILASTYAISFGAENLEGEGTERLIEDARDAQFVLVGEQHHERNTPRFTAALFRMLREAYGFNYAALEQDPLAMERMSAEPLRGNLDLIADYARANPYQVTFNSDEELRLIAEVGKLSEGKWQPVWGAEQAFGAKGYLQELVGLAPTAKARASVEALLAEATLQERAPRESANRHFMADQSIELLERFKSLREEFASRPGSRSDFLIGALTSSAEIYSYYRRSAQGEEDVGILNNVARESEMRQRFMHHYRHALAADGRAPRVLLKYGNVHLLRGRGRQNAFTLGAFVNELAHANDMTALSIQIITFGDSEDDTYGRFDDFPAWARAFSLNEEPESWTLIDTRPLRARWHEAPRSFGLGGSEASTFQNIVFGYDYVIMAPGARPSPKTMIEAEAQT